MAVPVATDSTATRAPFSLSVPLALDPPTFQKGDAVELSAIVVSHAPKPITILTYRTILDLDCAQKLIGNRATFQCLDLNTDTSLQLQIRKCMLRSPISHRLDHSDVQYFHTLEPEVPYKFSEKCLVPNRDLTPGHRYLLSANPENEIRWWRHGKKEDNLQKLGEELPDHMWKSSGGPISMSVEPVEFTVPDVTS